MFDIDVMDERRDFTIDTINFPDINDYIAQLRASGMRIITMLVSYIITLVDVYTFSLLMLSCANFPVKVLVGLTIARRGIVVAVLVNNYALYPPPPPPK